MFERFGAPACLLKPAICLVGIVVCAPNLWAQETLHFDALDRTYSEFVEELAPIQLSSLTVVLRSPEHSMSLESHSARLTPLGDSRYDTIVTFSFHGQGMLDADVTIGLVESQLQDQITLPQQSLQLAGRVHIESGESGYTIRLIESFQETADVQIESQIASRIIPLCKQLAFVLVSLPCDILQEALSVVRVPIPQPGTTFFLSRTELTGEEASHFDAYLAKGSEPMTSTDSVRPE